MRLIPLVLILLMTACGGGGGSNPQTAAVSAATGNSSSGSTDLSPAESDIPELLTSLDNLTFVEFTEASFELITRRYPESALSGGLADVPVAMNDLSAEYTADTNELVAGILNRLLAYEPVPDEQAILYGIYQHYLEDLVAGADYELYNYPASYFITGVPSQTNLFFSSIHPLQTDQDAQDYLDRLRLVDTKFKQLEAMVSRAEANGIVMPRILLQVSIDQHRRVVNSPSGSTAYVTRLTSDLPGTGLSQSRQNEILNEANAIVSNEVQPAYASLITVLENQLPVAPANVGVGNLPGGADYYQYTLRHHTTTDLSPDDIHELGLTEIVRIHEDMRIIFQQLGYPASASISENLSRAAVDGGTIQPSDIVPEYERIVADAESRLPEAFGVLPAAELIVVGGTTGGFYIRPAPDGSRPGAFHAANTRSEPAYLMRSLAYHEGVPGHHLQIALAQEQGESRIQQHVTFTGFVEGWALYAEWLAADLGWYEGDPYGDLGRLQYEAFRAARLVVDTAIHSRGWSFDQAVDYFASNTGFPRSTAEGQIARYSLWPGQATAYMVGMLQILELRETAEQDPDFDLKEFHDNLLQRGSVPLTMLSEE